MAEPKLEEIVKNVFHINFDEQPNLASTFLRFQEHYESSEFKGKIFTLEEFKKYYITNSPEGKKTGEFTYYEDWNGFNIPSNILQPFYEGKFDPLSEEEELLLDVFKEKKTDFYIIGTCGKGVALTHEVAHGLFYINSEYKEKVSQIVSKINTKNKEKLIGYLLSLGYHPDVYDDEIQAFLIDDTTESFEDLAKDLEDIDGVRAELRSVFSEHYLIQTD